MSSSSGKLSVILLREELSVKMTMQNYGGTCSTQVTPRLSCHGTSSTQVTPRRKYDPKNPSGFRTPRKFVIHSDSSDFESGSESDAEDAAAQKARGPR